MTKKADTEPRTAGKGVKTKALDTPDDKKAKKDDLSGPKGHMVLHIDSVTTGNQASEVNTEGKFNISPPRWQDTVVVVINITS